MDENFDKKVTIVAEKSLMDLVEESTVTLYDLLPIAIKKASAKIPEDIKSMDDGELIKQLNQQSEDRGNCGQGRLIDRQRDMRLKHSLWHEYDKAMEEGRKISLTKIHHGIITERGFRNLCENPMRLEWVMRPPTNYWNEQRVLLEKSTIGLHEILDQPIVTHQCRCHYICQCNRGRKVSERIGCVCLPDCKCPPKVNVKLGALKQKIHEMLELRVKGSIPQVMRMDKKVLTAHVNAYRKTEENNEDAAKQLPKTSQGIDEELEMLRSELKELKSGKRVDTIEVLTEE